MAEGFAKKIAGPDLSVASAGTEPSTVNPMAVKTMAEFGIDISSYKSKSIADLGKIRFDLVITLCDRARATCPVFPGAPGTVHWSIEDPAAFKGSDAEIKHEFKKTAEIIKGLVYNLLNRGYLDAFIRQKHNIDAIFSSMPMGIIAHDPNRRIFFFSKQAEKITGFYENEVMGKDCHELFKPNFCGENCSFCEGDNRDIEKNLNYTTLFTAKNGIRRELDITVVPLKEENGKTTGVLACLNDRTRQKQLERRLEETIQFSGIIGQDHKMHLIYDMIKDLSESDVPVVISGESGTGKELVAHAVHRHSPRRDKLFVPINCGALPQGTLESELFGHVRGAFTGAIRDKKGRFELADKGTIFLDEVCELPPSVQVKLLRVLQEGTFEPVGGEKTVKVDVRMLSASNKDIRQMVEKGEFREDLYYRLAVVPVDLPPLRERKNDIPLLCEHFLKAISEKQKRQQYRLADESLSILMNYRWPGNVRQLQNALQFSVVKCRMEETIKTEHLPPEIVSAVQSSALLGDEDPGGVPGKPGRKPKLNARSVELAITKTGGNKAKAARMLGVGRATLYNFIKDHPNILENFKDFTD
jgi:PAS domain S-box-containing protein